MKEPDLDALSLPTGAQIAYDMAQHPVVLFANEWSANYFGQTNPKVPLSSLPPEIVRHEVIRSAATHRLPVRAA